MHRSFLLLFDTHNAADPPPEISTQACGVLISSNWPLTWLASNRVVRKIILGVNDLIQDGIMTHIELWRGHEDEKKSHRDTVS